MSIRRSIITFALAMSLGGAVAPLVTQAQNDPATRPGTTDTMTDRNDGPDLGWIGLAGLAGLLGLFGNRTRNAHDFAGGRTTATHTAR